jgi:ribokinase
MKPFEVIGVGDADIDIYLDVDHIPTRDEKMLAQSFSYHPGGMVANFLVALSRLGTACGFHGTVGDDDFGHKTLKHMEVNDVDIQGAIIKPDSATYFCVVMLDESGEKALIVAPTDAIFPKPEELSESVIGSAKHLHTTANLKPTVLKALRLARQHGLTVSVDIERDQLDQFEDLQSLLSLIDLVFVNKMAAGHIAGEVSNAEAAQKILSFGPEIVCVTLGAAGSHVAAQGIAMDVDPFPVKVVDSTGAGDCFAAGFVHGYLKGWPMKKTAVFASAVGALSVTNRGGSSNTPTTEDVYEFLKQRNVEFT